MRKSTTLAYYSSNLAVCTVLSSANVTLNINTDTFNNFKQMLAAVKWGIIKIITDQMRSAHVCNNVKDVTKITASLSL